ncbi:HAD family hydrolase [Fodinicola feengrottensis]|uniref:HAD family hydrolase n=1 Tax=Fodinicola feengrottensis TaxID=435914 RepID=UPI002442517B|nr:HAD family hydrolase [Fodinicola feengrottensis]
MFFDVFETLLSLEPLRDRIVEVGQPAHLLELFFARTLRDGMALTLAGTYETFGAVARSALAQASGWVLEDDQIEYVVSGFAELPIHKDVTPALDLLADAGVRARAFTHGQTEVVASALRKAGVYERFTGVMSSADVHTWKPPRPAYLYACATAGVQPHQAALVAAHSWDTHGAGRAGLTTGFVTRLEGRVPPIVDTPDVVAERLDEVVAGLLTLPQ